MTEERILRLFNKIGSGDDVNLGLHGKLRRDVAVNTSKTIADVIYDSGNSKNPIVLNKRKDCLRFLRIFSGVPLENHLRLERNNYDTAVQLLNEANELDVIEELVIAAKEEQVNSYVSTLEEIYDFYTKQDKAQKELNDFRGLIAKKDQEVLGNLRVIPTVAKLESIDDFFSRFLFDNVLSKANIRECLCDCTKIVLQNDFETYRQKQVACGYGLLNLDQSEADLKLFMKILKRISLYTVRKDYELEFLMHIFSRSDTPEQFLRVLCETFSFIYEKALINIGTSLIQMNDHGEQLMLIENSPELKRLLNVSAFDTRLKIKIEMMLYELYSLSNYQKEILMLVEAFE